MKPTLALPLATLLVGLTLVLNSLIPKMGEYVPHGERISRLVPFQVDDWVTRGDSPAGEDEKRVLGTDDIIHRLYRNSNFQDVWLALVFSAGHRNSMHPPEVCLQAGGLSLVSRKVLEITPGFSATVLQMSGTNDQLFNYWFFTKGNETPSYLWHQVHLVWNQVLFQTQPSVLIRVSTNIENKDATQAQETLSKFVIDFLPVLRESLPVD